MDFPFFDCFLVTFIFPTQIYERKISSNKNENCKRMKIDVYIRPSQTNSKRHVIPDKQALELLGENEPIRS